MKPAPTPQNKRHRLAAQLRYGILDTEPDQAFADLGQPAAQVRDVPMADIRFLNRDRKWLNRTPVIDNSAANSLIVRETLPGRSPHDRREQRPAAYIHGAPFHLVILDCRMPDRDGFSVAEAMRASPDLASTTAIMLISEVRSGNRVRAQGVDITTHLRKPLRWATRVNVVATMLTEPMKKPPLLAALDQYLLPPSKKAAA